MASSGRSPDVSVKSELESKPYRFSFIQAVRLLQQVGASQDGGFTELGTDSLPDEESLRLGVLPARKFPPAEVAELGAFRNSVTDLERPKLLVTFMGLFGPCGVLPQHDTQRVIDAARDKGPNPERDLLDLFNHRLLSLYFRASTKYRLAFGFEKNYRTKIPDLEHEPNDLATRALYSIAGLGFSGLRSRLEVKDELAIEYAGILGHSPKNAVSLQRMLQAYFELPVDVEQFSGHWLTLSAENQSKMPSRLAIWGRNCELGKTFILGDRIWDVAGKFRIRVGPLNREQFNRLLPGQPDLRKLAQVAQLYAGQQFDFDIQLELMASDIPSISLDGKCQLGFNTWLFCTQPTTNKTEAVFVQTGVPNDN